MKLRASLFGWSAEVSFRSLKADRSVERDDDFYPSSPSAQISNLGFLLSAIFGERDDGFFLEVGGFDGFTASNTWGLATRGWTGVYVEPIPEFAGLCRENHAANPNISVLERAIDSVDGDNIEFKISGALTTANETLFQEYRQQPWAQQALTGKRAAAVGITLDSFLREQDFAVPLDLLVVDVEGMEERVFAGFALEEWMPTALIVELADVHPDLRATRMPDYRISRRLDAAGYVLIYKDHINSVFVDRAHWESRLATSSF